MVGEMKSRKCHVSQQKTVCRGLCEITAGCDFGEERVVICPVLEKALDERLNGR